MFSSSVFYALLSIAVSFIVGALFYYVMKDDTSKNKRKQIEEVGSQIINFVIYIWIGKIVFKFPIFIKDPMAVLPYPSDSKAFYFASGCIFIHILLKYRGKKKRLALIYTFLPIFIVSQFAYEFIQIVFLEAKPNWALLIFYSVLILLYMILQNKLAESQFHLYILTILILGNLLLAVFSQTYIFGYSLSFVYFVAMFLLMLTLFFINNKSFVYD